ncbi:MAG TPA: hypothetical protein VFA07_10700 [Chthonomonadaceae bacterium]|nr:hypothetical protein [Chthonomonadaceae bacterium]
MVRRDTPLEAWEYRALQEYVREEGSAAQAILAAQALVRRAQLLICSGLLTSSDGLSVDASRPAFERLSAARLEYRLYSLFAD